MNAAALVVRHASLRAFALAILERWGTPRPIAETAVELMVETDLRGVDSHGVGMLPTYHRSLKDSPKAEGAGRLCVAGEPEWECEPRRRREGIPLAPGLVTQLRQVATATGVPFTLG